ncbi:family 16 glycosylhydrolase [Emticicia sp. TH156]|uniref:glycoside hydrolase family 16 protein n=1 Tax=Emticicia sp. TH156 TaxID=2067454 RepID=UPI000C77182D|nr:glycoside hydrolase family 16 protein [Emticicia sp. TH156]PLK45366.1 glycoside hydrolase [Emticicia sp. TH156]
MKKTLVFSLGLSVLLLYVACQKTGQNEVNTEGTFKYDIDKSAPVWADEFNYTGLPDTGKWSYDTGGNGWGNDEKQFYTKDAKNARVENGVLIIEARKEKFENNNYTSARLVTKNKADFLYGRFEIKAKLPKGRGTWPAAWMLATEKSYGANYWPDNGEIDIIEHVGYDQNRIHGNIHTKAFNHTIKTNKGNNVVVPGVSDDFHVYACEWTPDKISIEIDGNKYFTFTREANYGWAEWPFDKKFHLLLNIAVGGSWGGQQGIDDNIFPQRMEVDYVRVYQASKK